MALTPIQRDVCRQLAESRVASGESYVAGGVALNELLAAPRLSRDIDLFHDTDEALRSSWESDRTLLVARRLQRFSYADASARRGTLRFHAGSIRGAVPRV